jgi:hypothetical protein
MVEEPIEDETLVSADRRTEAFYYLSFIFWPLGTMVASLKRWNSPWSKNVFWLFCIFFGFTFIISKEGGADSARYAQSLIQYSQSDLDLRHLLNSFYSESSGSIDIASPLITFLVSRITHNPNILFTVFGLIFGYFFSRNIWYVLNRIDGNFSILILLYFITFALINPIWNINGFRMWTAAQIFLYGTIPYIMEGSYKKLPWLCVSVLFHFSFMFTGAILVLFVFLKNKLTIYLFFFIVTSFIKELNLESVQSALSFLPDIFQSRVSSYTNLDYAESINRAVQSDNWYLHFASKGIGWVTYVLVLVIYIFCREFLKNRHDLMTLFCFSILLYGFSSIFSKIPSGGRFISVSLTFMFTFFTIFFSEVPKMKGLLLIKSIIAPLLLLYIIVRIREGMDFFGLVTIIGNPIFAVLHSDTVPLIDGIKSLF